MLTVSFSASDPTETWAAEDFRSAKGVFVPSLKGDIVPVLHCMARPPAGGSHGNPIRRREFITLLCGAAAWPLAARAQQPAKLPTIGVLGRGTPSAWSQWVAAFVQRLRELGWIEGRTVAIEYRWAEGRTERYAEIAAEFVRLKVDVIVTAGERSSRGKAGDIGHPDRLRGGGRPGWQRHGRELGATGRQRHRPVDSSRPISPASDSNSCARLFPVSAGWRS